MKTNEGLVVHKLPESQEHSFSEKNASCNDLYAVQKLH